MVDKITLLSETARISFEREVEINTGLDHPFLTHFLKCFHDDNATYIIMEFAPGGDLLKRIQTQHHLKEGEMQHIFCEMMSALNYIHNIKHYVHRDLKLDNILFDSSGNIRIIDFGLSGEITEEKPLLNTQCGSFYYTAPEVIKKKPYSYPVDIWSSGVILYAMATGNLPFVDNNSHNLMQKITAATPEFPATVSKPLQDLILQMLQKNPDERITIPQIAQHKWVQDSRYAFYISENFLYSPKYRCIPKSAKDVDHEVLAAMKNLNIQVDNILQDIADQAENDATMCYKIIKKQRVIQMIGSTAEIRMMYNMRRSVPSKPVRPPIEITSMTSMTTTTTATTGTAMTKPLGQCQALTPPEQKKRRSYHSKSVFENRKKPISMHSHLFGTNLSLPPLREKKT